MKKEILGFEGYAIDTDGNVWSRKNGRWGLREKYKKLKPGTINPGGHLVVVLHKNNKAYTKYVHRLILETFISPCPEGKESCHNDGDPKNNNLQNLRWDTPSGNRKDQFKHGTSVKGETHGNAKLNELQVRIIRRYLGTNTFLAKVFNVRKQTISDIRTGRRWKHL